MALVNGTTRCSGEVDCNRLIIEQPVSVDALTPRYGAFCEAFLARERRSRDAPAFLVAAPHQPHNPHAPGLAFQGTSDLGLYGDIFAEVDSLVAAVLRCAYYRACETARWIYDATAPVGAVTRLRAAALWMGASHARRAGLGWSATMAAAVIAAARVHPTTSTDRVLPFDEDSSRQNSPSKQERKPAEPML